MSAIVSQFEELKPEQEELETTSTIMINQQEKKYPASPVVVVSPVPSVAQTSAEYRSSEAKRYYLTSRLSKLVNLYTLSPPYQLSSINEQAEDSEYDIAVYTLAQPINRQIINFQASPKSQRGKFLATLISQLPRDLPHPQSKILEAPNPQEQHHRKLLSYFNSLRDEARVTGGSEFSKQVIDIAWEVWKILRSYFMAKGLCLKVPDACPGQRDNFMYTWSEGEHYLECEIFGSGEIEFFYRNRKTAQVWGEDTTLKQGFSNAIFGKVELFT